MRGRFPPDLLVVFFGPVLVAIIAVALGSVIFHTQQLRWSVFGYGIVAATVITLMAVLVLRIRRRH